MLTLGFIVIIISFIAACMFVVEIIFTTNTTIRIEENVRNDYSNMLNAISNRNRLESVLNDIVKGYLAYENNICKSITNINAVIAMSPNLRGNNVILNLLQEIKQSEDTILYSKAQYNFSVLQYNQYIRCFPAIIFSIATKYSFERVGEKSVPIVDKMSLDKPSFI